MSVFLFSFFPNRQINLERFITNLEERLKFRINDELPMYESFRLVLNIFVVYSLKTTTNLLIELNQEEKKQFKEKLTSSIQCTKHTVKLLTFIFMHHVLGFTSDSQAFIKKLYCLVTKDKSSEKATHQENFKDNPKTMCETTSATDTTVNSGPKVADAIATNSRQEEVADAMSALQNAMSVLEKNAAPSSITNEVADDIVTNSQTSSRSVESLSATDTTVNSRPEVADAMSALPKDAAPLSTVEEVVAQLPPKPTVEEIVAQLPPKSTMDTAPPETKSYPLTLTPPPNEENSSDESEDEVDLKTLSCRRIIEELLLKLLSTMDPDKKLSCTEAGERILKLSSYLQRCSCDPCYIGRICTKICNEGLSMPAHVHFDNDEGVWKRTIPNGFCKPQEKKQRFSEKEEEAANGLIDLLQRKRNISETSLVYSDAEKRHKITHDTN